VICVTCGSLGLENELEIFLSLGEDVRENERKKRSQFLKVVLQRRSGKKKLELGRDSDKLLVSLGLDVFEIMTLIVNTNL
jgi:hypothetical protein